MAKPTIAQRRQRVADLMNKSPVQRIGEAIMSNGASYPDQVASNFAKGAAKKFKKGTYTASQTGAKQLAAERFSYAQNREILNAAGAGTEAFEKRAVAKSPRPTRSKR